MPMFLKITISIPGIVLDIVELYLKKKDSESQRLKFNI